MLHTDLRLATLKLILRDSSHPVNIGKTRKGCYRPHPKDGKGTFFTGVCLPTPGGGGFTPSPSHNTSTSPMSFPGGTLVAGPRSLPGGYPVLGYPLARSECGTLSQDWGTSPPPSPPGQNSRASTYYAAGGMPLAFTREDCLVWIHYCNFFFRHDEKPKKIWQPPKAPSAAEPAQPTKPPRTFEYAKSKSPAKAVVTDEATSDFMKRIAPSKFSPAKHISPVKFSPSKGVTNEKSPKTSPVKTKFFPSPKTVVSTMTVKLANTPSPGKSHRRESVDTGMDEPTKKPISARFAVWEKKSFDKGDAQVEPTKQPVSTRMSNWENKVGAWFNVVLHFILSWTYYFVLWFVQGIHLYNELCFCRSK